MTYGTVQSFRVEDCHYPHSSRASSLHPTSPDTLPSISSSGKSHDRPSTKPGRVVSFEDAHEIVASAQKTLQEWNTRWGSNSNFSFRAICYCLELGHVKVPVDHARGEILAMVQKGRDALLDLETIAYIDLHSVKHKDFPNFFIEMVRVIKGLHERIARADEVLRVMQTIA